jgi:hypothetical protein
MAGDGRAETSEPLEREADAGVAVGDAVVGVLITFPMSHYCEKARWALDHAGVG